MGIEFRSYAKLNLYLEVLNKRPDGYHNILTIFQMIDLHDKIHLNFNNSGRITVKTTRKDVPENEDNLVYMAIERFQEKTGLEFGADVFIEKNIPPGGGLGGGSSNAVATILALNKHFNYPLDHIGLKGLADSLGSDTAFFLYGGTVLAQGRGEKIIEILPTPDMWFILICPNLSVNTGKAYEEVSRALTKPEGDVNILTEALKGEDIERIGSNLFNHFTALLMDEKEVVEVYAKLKNSNGVRGVSITGSGSCVFALIDERDAAGRLLPQFQGNGDCWICRSISSSEYVKQFNKMEA